MPMARSANSKFTAALDLPLEEGSCDTVDFRTERLNFLVTIRYTNSKGSVVFGIAFEGFTAFRFRDEMHSRGFLKESYNCVCEILESDWIAELVRDRPTGKRYSDMKHFAVLFSDFGYLEVACEELHPFTPMAQRNDSA
jgi:hypothetical protein